MVRINLSTDVDSELTVQNGKSNVKGSKMAANETPPAKSPDTAQNAGVTLNWILILAFTFWITSFFASYMLDKEQVTLPYSAFLEAIDKNEVNDLSLGKEEIRGNIVNHKQKYFRTIPVEDPELIQRLQNKHIKYQGKISENVMGNFFFWGLVVFFILSTLGGAVRMMMSKEGFGPGLLPIERNKAKIFMEDKIKTTFADVAGVDEAKEELQEVIGFLKDPKKYGRLGGHLPKGILLVGPPGTGKTLLARAVAGEAGVPFFSISGSEFVELYVGVGAARVRDLFEQAQKNAPCILFVDELDALGRARGISGNMGGHDEKEQTLNQLLVEMDGFDPRQGVVVLAATNRPEILDAALLRAGRFDRQVLVDRPDRLARLQILQVHLKDKVISKEVIPEEIAASTPGFTGADLANLVNEAVLLATRREAMSVEQQDFTQALERIVTGLEKKNRFLNTKERNIVAHHEMGHALVAMSLPGCDEVQKVSIIPRGMGALGYTLQRPVEDRYLVSFDDLCNKLAALLGGRAAEIIVFGDASSGSSDDLAKATNIARSMVTKFGMSSTLGPVSYETEPQTMLSSQGSLITQKNYSEETAREIDCAVKDLITKQLDKAISVLTKNKKILIDGANILLAQETLEKNDLELLMRPEASSRTKQEALS
ncbi:MAG: ATP-dependent zinc metalloprotease FtsH [Candidatus Melainabacteria bacterium]|nr:ATP-dependent zinc metalloprotease FtsH [Candidatus Melainabacteria bacterium]